MKNLALKWKLLIGFFALTAFAILLGVLFPGDGKNEAFQPQQEFKLDPWVEIHIGGLDLSITKAVFYLIAACILTCVTMIWVSRRMQQKPNKIQTAIEVSFTMAKENIVGANMDTKMAARWFPFIAALFFFIWFSNMLGYIPLPVNTHETIDIFGMEAPSLALYSATANLSIPLVLTLVIWFSYHIEGMRAKGPLTYVKSNFVPPGITGPAVIPLFAIEVISDFVRIISLSVRLFANILAGHLLILFMAGGLVVLLGLPTLGVFTMLMAIPFYVFEVGLVATLQAFIFATLTSIYLGAATAEHH